MKRICMLALSASVIAAGVAAAQTRPTTPTTPPQPTRTEQPQTMVAAVDADFVKKLAEGGKKEVELGKMASTKAGNAEVKSFAKRMVTDHGKANAELEKIARAKRIDLMAAGDTKRDPMPPRPADPSKPTDPAVKTPAPSAPEGDDQLKSLSGAAFDRAYMDMMVTKHRATVEVLEKQTRDGEDAEIKAWAAKALPAVREHLELAEDLQRKLGSTSSR